MTSRQVVTAYIYAVGSCDQTPNYMSEPVSNSLCFYQLLLLYYRSVAVTNITCEYAYLK